MGITPSGLSVATDKAIIAGRVNLEKLSNFSVDYSPEQSEIGLTTKIPVYSGEASTFDESTNGYNTGNVDVKWATVTFDDHKKCTFPLSGLDVLQVEQASCWKEGGETTGKALTKAVVKKVESILTYTDRAGQVASWSTTIENMANLVTEVSERGWDASNCSVILTPAHYGTLLSLLPASTFGGPEAIRNGYVPNLFGFRSIMMGTYISKDDSGSSKKGAGFVVPYNAVAVGVRIPKALEGTVVTSGIGTDEVTGLSIGYRVTADQNGGKLNWTSEVLIGASLTAKQDTGAPGYLQLVTA